jgi:hypothetical protein
MGKRLQSVNLASSLKLILICTTDSDILYLEFLGQPVIILNSAEASNELLEKRGAKHSDRPKFYFFEE